MIGSFISGLSGIRANQTMLEVVGNNIANANTVGFKAARATFSDVLSRTLQSATATHAPMQVGRGTQVAAITTLVHQGGLQETNRESDLAIQGRGYFIVSNGEQNFYTRAGGFVVSENGELVTLDGFKVQGFTAVNGVIPPGAVQGTIRFPSEPIPPRATSLVAFSGNLDAATKVFATDVSGQSLRIGGGDGIIGTPIAGSVSLADDGTTLTLRGQGTAFTTDLAGVTEVAVGGRLYTISAISSDTELTLERPVLSGTIQVANGSNAVVGTDTQFTTQLRVGDTLSINGVDVQVTAIQDDTHLTISSPVTSEVPEGTPLNFGTSAGVAPVTGERVETTVLPSRTTRLFEVPLRQFPVGEEEMGNILVEEIATGRRIVVSIAGDKTLADFEAMVQRQGLTNYTLNASGFRLMKLDPTNGAATSFRAIDSEGNTHTAVLMFFRMDTPNTWAWRLTIPDAEGLPQDPNANYFANTQGIIEFHSDGTLKSFRNLENADQFTLRFNANSSAQPLSIEMNVEVVRAMTQFNLKSDPTLSRNNGAFSGEFQSFTVEKDGTILGSFSNGEVRTLGRLALADFVNPTGLSRVGANLYAQTENSGNPLVSIAGEGGFGTIVSGALELSNVQIAEEFTQMILAQRGFQASANVITTTDSLMNEVINLKRG